MTKERNDREGYTPMPEENGNKPEASREPKNKKEPKNENADQNSQVVGALIVVMVLVLGAGAVFWSEGLLSGSQTELDVDNALMPSAENASSGVPQNTPPVPPSPPPYTEPTEPAILTATSSTQNTE